jgi:hypothetical protein
MKRDIAIIAEREASSMVSVWREYLCLRAGSAKRFQAFIGVYQSLERASRFYNDDTGDYVLPEKIEGHLVHGIEDEWVVGGDLDYYYDEDQIEFDTVSDDSLFEWLSKHGWMDALPKLNKAVSRPASAG